MDIAASYLYDLAHNSVFLCTVLSWVAAQVIKFLLLLCLGRGDFSRLASGGGMPSSHTATSFGLLMSTILRYGTGGFEVVMATFFMIIVVYDSLNVRYITGEQNKILNHLIRKGQEEEDPFLLQKKANMKELLGHTLPEVIVGAIVGIAVPIIFNAVTHGSMFVK